MTDKKVILLQHPLWDPSIREFTEVHGLRILESEKKKSTGITFVEDQEYELPVQDAEESSSTKEIESDDADGTADQGTSSESNRKQKSSSKSKTSGK